jgi:hypothetical protein
LYTGIIQEEKFQPARQPLMKGGCMGSVHWDTGGQKKKKAGVFPVFRFRRSHPGREGSSATPFTEMPAELRKNSAATGRTIRRFINVLFLLILVIALVGLVAAFSYQMINHPQEMWAWSSSLVSTVQDFIQSLIATPN